MSTEAPARTNELIIKRPHGWPGGGGDQRQTWNPDNETETKLAKKAFDNAKKEGFIAYTVDPDTGRAGEVMRTFDPQAGKVIMRPPVRGG
jgi:hypothetical protein